MICAFERDMVSNSVGEFKAILRWVLEETDGDPIHEVERELFARLLGLGRLLLGSFVEKQGDGNVGPALQREGGTRLGFVQNQKRTYFSIFGKLDIHRAYYWSPGVGKGVFPLDEKLSLPARSYSYFLQEWTELLGTEKSLDKVTAQMEKWLRIKVWKRPLEVLSREAAEDVEGFYAQREEPDQQQGEVLVVAVDGKGIPMCRGTQAAHKVRLKRGEKRSRKKQATVSTIYCTEVEQRTPEEIVQDVRPRGTDQKAHSRDKPKKYTKQVRGTLVGKDAAFRCLVGEIEKRDPQRRKKRAALMDGDRALEKKAKQYLPGFVLILDLFHVLEYLWKAAHIFHKEDSPEAEEWVRHRLLSLLQGKVGRVIGGLRQSLTKRKLSGKKRRILEGVVGYLNNHRCMMRYDEYLRAGYPIGSGAVEGACRHLVRDRFELTGMRWTEEGAEAMLGLRATALNEHWEEFWDYHIAREHERLYPHAIAA